MKIERIASEFQPIVITLDTQEDVNLLFNACFIVTQQYEKICDPDVQMDEQLNVTSEEESFSQQVCTALEPFVTTE